MIQVSLRFSVSRTAIGFVAQSGFLRGSGRRLIRDLRKIWLPAAFALLCCTYSSFASSRQKTDVVYMHNGDRITGEISSLSKGQLAVKPSYSSSSIILDWDQVDHLESSQLFVVTGSNGISYEGSLRGGAQKQTLTIHTATNTTLTHQSVIEISELGSTFLKRLSGNISVGTSFSRSNAQSDLTVASGLSYQSTEQIVTFSSNAQFSTQQKTTDTNETTAKAAYLHQLRASAWYGGADRQLPFQFRATDCFAINPGRRACQACHFYQSHEAQYDCGPGIYRSAKRVRRSWRQSHAGGRFCSRGPVFDVPVRHNELQYYLLGLSRA